MRKAIPIAGLVLVIAAFSSTAALGKAKGTDRPLMWSATGTSALNTLTGQNSIALNGHGTHMGQFEQTELAFVTPTGTPGTFNFNSTWTVVVANGDELSGTCTGQSTTTDGVHIVALLDCVSTSGTGTGRFEDASSTFEAIINATRVSIVGPIANSVVEATGEGTISY